MRELFWSTAAFAGLVIGCDTSRPAAGPDASGPDTATPEVPLVRPRDPDAPVNLTLRIADALYDSGTTTVVFQNPDGSVVYEGVVEGMAGSTGHAQAVMPLGGTVSTIDFVTYLPEQPNFVSMSITSILGVQPGDDISLLTGSLGCSSGSGPRARATTQLPPNLEATSLHLFSSCGEVFDRADPLRGTAEAVLDPESNTFDVLAVASGGPLPTPQFIAATGITYSSERQIELPGAYAPMERFTIHLTNLPAEISGLTARRATLIGAFSAAPQGLVSSDPPAGELALLLPYPPDFGAGNEISLGLKRPDPDATERYELHTASPSSSVDVDLSQLRLPPLTELAMTNAGVTWSADSAQGSPDGMRTTWRARLDGTVIFSWTVIQPFDPSGMTFPSLPPNFINPAHYSGTVQLESASVTIGDYDNITGYDQLRLAPNALLTSPINQLRMFDNTPFQRRLFTANYQATSTGP